MTMIFFSRKKNPKINDRIIFQEIFNLEIKLKKKSDRIFEKKKTINFVGVI